MKMKSSPFVMKVVLAAGLLAAPMVHGANFTWSGASGADLFWNTAGNWSPGGPPSTNDFAIFFDDGTTNEFGATGVDNEVTSNRTVKHLWLSQTNGFHNLVIDPGVTLTVAGTNDNGYGPIGSNPNNSAPTNGFDTFFVGTRNPPPNAAAATTNTISGAGTLLVNNTNNELNVRETFAGGGGAHQAVLDMSGLNTFVAKLGRIRVGDGEFQPLTRAQGQLRLAMTNTITLTGTNSADNVQLVIGNNDVNNNGNGGNSFLFLGQVNTLQIDKILVGAQKTPGQLLFNSAFASPSFLLRGSDGVSRVSAIRIGDESDAGGTGNPTTGTVNLLAGTSDILADTIIVGKGQNGPNATAATGNLLVGAGVVDVNTLQLAAQFVSNQGGVMTGTATFSNTTVVVNKLLELGHSTGAAPARNATLNITGGSFTVMSNLVTGGTATMRVTNSVLALQSHPSVLASVLVLDGGSISNVAVLKVTNSLTIVNNGQIIGGNPAFDMGTSPSAVWDVQGAPGGNLTVSNSFTGGGSLNGNLIQASGAAINPGGTGAAGTLTISGTSGNVTLNGGALQFDLSNNGSGANDQLNASGTVTLNGTNTVNLTALNGAFDTVNPYTLINSSGLVGGDQTYFNIGGGLAQSRYTFTFATDASSVKLSIGGAGPASLKWVGDNSVNNWDLKTTANWNNGAPAQFFSLDAVMFDDTGSASPAVNLVGTLNPGSIAMTNATKNYVFSGTGGLTGAALSKDGMGSLTFNNTGDNSFGGLVSVVNGNVTFGNTGLNTFVGGLTLTGGGVMLSGANTNVIAPGNMVAIGTGTSFTLANANANIFNAVPIQLDGAMTVTQAVNSIIDGNLAGAGAFTKTGGGTLTLAGDNSGLGSVIQINGGTVKAGSATALGFTGVIITNSATLDLNGQNPGGVPVTVSGSGAGGNGAIVSTAGILISGASGIGLNNVTLAGDTTFGGSGPWDTDPIKNFGVWGITGGALNTGGASYKLTKVGLNQVSLNSASVDTALGDIDVQQGLLDLAGGTSSLGNPTNTITVRAGAQLSFNTTSTPWDKKFVLIGDGVTPNLLNYNGANIIIGPVTLNNSCVMGAVSLSRGAPVSLTLSGPVGGTGGLIKSGADALILAGTNNFAGTTIVSGGQLLVDGANQSASSVTASGGTLGGLGAISGPVTIASGGMLSPGDLTTALGTLSIKNTVSLSGTCAMDLDKTSSVLTSDQVTNITALTVGGTLQLNITGDTALAVGDAFKLFSFGSASGSFASISPSTPGDGLSWDTSSLTNNGVLKVAVAQSQPPVIGGVTLTGSSLVLNISNGINGETNYVLSATNLLTPLNQWTPLATNIFDVNGNSLWTNTINPATPQEFYRIQLP